MSDLGGRERPTATPSSSAGEATPGEGVYRRTFASDNFAGVHPEVMEAVLRANIGHAIVVWR